MESSRRERTVGKLWCRPMAERLKQRAPRRPRPRGGSPPRGIAGAVLSLALAAPVLVPLALAPLACAPGVDGAPSSTGEGSVERATARPATSTAALADPSDSPQSAGGAPFALDSIALRRAVAQAARIEPLSSLLVSWRGDRVVERYWRGMGPDRPVNVKSVSKTLLHPLVGAAIRDGHLEGVHESVAGLLPEHFRAEMDPRKRQITLGHLLSMSAGLETTSFSNYGEWVSSSDWVRNALERPVECDPGSCWEYSTGNTHLISAILTRATGKSTLAYAREVLFEPLGIGARAWDRDPQGVYLGGNNMSLTPREMLRFAELYLGFGRWEGRQVVPPEWILASWQPRARSPWNRHGYGYLWWIEEWAGERAYFGWGYGGQYVVVIPGLDLAVAATSDLSLRRRGHIREMRRFFDRWLVPAFADGARGAG